MAEDRPRSSGGLLHGLETTPVRRGPVPPWPCSRNPTPSPDPQRWRLSLGGSSGDGPKRTETSAGAVTTPTPGGGEGRRGRVTVMGTEPESWAAGSGGGAGGFGPPLSFSISAKQTERTQGVGEVRPRSLAGRERRSSHGENRDKDQSPGRSAVQGTRSSTRFTSSGSAWSGEKNRVRSRVGVSSLF